MKRVIHDPILFLILFGLILQTVALWRRFRDRSHRTVAVDSVGIEFDSHRIRVNVIEIDLKLKHVLLPIGLDLHFTEAQRGPIVLQGLLRCRRLNRETTMSLVVLISSVLGAGVGMFLVVTGNIAIGTNILIASVALIIHMIGGKSNILHGKE
jgi:hypothetical protein